MLILLDQDGVLADFESGFRREWQRRHPDHPPVPHQERRAFNVRDDYPPDRRSAAEEIYSSRGFFRGLDPLPGALQAVQSMLDLGHDVRICTTAIDAYEHCVLEKYQWVEQHLGREFTRRIILTTDKTLVAGDWLIDDKPEIVGARPPLWRHAVMDAPYNQRSSAALRIDWASWRRILD